MKNLFYFFCVSFLKKQLANNIFAFLTLLFLLLPQQSCNTTEPPPFKEELPKAIKLKLLDVSCTEAFIKVSAADTVLPVNITLKKDNTALFSFTLTKTDTVVIDTTLQPNITYSYQTTAQIKGKEENSDTIQVKTLNTTSHNFTWQKFEFGGMGGSSVLYDVAIINENDIWAVGEIYADTTGQAYNAVHWNGTSWELKRIQTYFRGNLITVPLEGIFAFSSTDIWMVGSLPIHGNGNDWTMYDLRTTVDPNLSLSKAWGSSSNDMYFVGRAGSIAHYKNGSWSKIESGTDLPINDIYGSANPFNGKTEVICVVSDAFINTGLKVIKIYENDSSEFLNNNGLKWSIGSIWFSAGVRYYIAGSGLYEMTYSETNLWRDLNLNRSITQYHMDCIRGNKLNDIIVTGAYGEVLHFNGLSWKSLRNSSTELSYGSYFKISIKGKMACMVGYDDRKAVILLGHHL